MIHKNKQRKLVFNKLNKPIKWQANDEDDAKRNGFHLVFLLIIIV